MHKSREAIDRQQKQQITKKGIMFIEPLYNQIVEGNKTMTRRIINLQPKAELFSAVIGGYDNVPSMARLWTKREPNNPFIEDIKLKYKVGETLYLKEPYLDDLLMDRIFYKYDSSDIEDLKHYANMSEELSMPGFWKNKMFMPTSAARRFIQITGVRAERINEISEDECKLEGISGFTKDMKLFRYGFEGDEWSEMPRTAKEAFKNLWNSINGKFKKDEKTGIYYQFPFDGESSDVWENGRRYITIANPWVFVYTFKLIERS